MRTVDLLDSSNLTEFHNTFREVFGGAISNAMVSWKYGSDRGLQYGVFSNEHSLVAHCGLIFRAALVEGKCMRIAQFGDLFGVREKTGGLARQSSAFNHLLTHMLKLIECQDNPYALTYGFPSGIAMRLMEKLKLGKSLNVIHELTFRPRAVKQTVSRFLSGREPALCQVDKFDSDFGRLVERLWADMAVDFDKSVLGKRNLEYINYRYIRHPEFKYEIYRVSPLFGAAIGLVICKRIGNDLEVMDVIGSLSNIIKSIRCVQSTLKLLEGGLIKMWLLDQYAHHFSEFALNIQPLEFNLMVNHNSSGGHLDRFKNRWWLTSGDTDYR